MRAEVMVVHGVRQSIGYNDNILELEGTHTLISKQSDVAP